MRYIIVFLLPLFIFAKNNLANQESPYLQQHVNNPVNWYPWGKEAFDRAKKENKLIFLSIGYSTCHWCHVMERESFENKEIAKLLNKDYIAIKVDKEERPDIDRYYQRINRVINQKGGGWPLTVILTPDKKPIFSATYIPAYDKYGLRGLNSLLPLVAKEYYKNPKKYNKIANSIIEATKELNSNNIEPKEVSLSVIKKAMSVYNTIFDREYGGFGRSVKFPSESSLDLLLTIYQVNQDKNSINIVNKTLTAMAEGGIYDQIEGAFYRYSTRRDFLVPHFEKMLYTNANLIELYSKAYLITKKALYKKVILESIREIDRRFKYKNLYFSASDADTKGVEGGYFIYGYDEALDAMLKSGFSKKEAKEQLKALGISFEGNLEDNLNNPSIKAKVSKKAIKALRELRAKREYPFIDKKIITSWNAMYINAKLKASLIEPSLKEEALKSLDTLIKKLYLNNKLYHQMLPEKKPSKEAMLEDYAFLIKALITAHQITLKSNYLELANTLLKESKNRFYIDNKWYFSTKDYKLIASLENSSYASSLGVMFLNMLSLASINEDYKEYLFAKKSIEAYYRQIEQNPSYYPSATIAAIRLKVGDIIVQAKKEKLLKYQKNLFTLHPFVVLKDSDIEGFSLCKIDRCFAKVKDFSDIKKAIKENF